MEGEKELLDLERRDQRLLIAIVVMHGLISRDVNGNGTGGLAVITDAFKMADAMIARAKE